MRALLALAALLLSCAPEPQRDAVLILRIRVPYEEGDRPIARVQVNPDEARFRSREPWATPKPFPVDLRNVPNREIELAVRSEDPEATSSQALLVRIAFCDPDGEKPCDRDADTPELAYVIAKPFYAGEVTEWHAGPKEDDTFHMPDSEVPSHQDEFPRLGDLPAFIKACSVEGCLQVSDEPGAEFAPDPRTGYCRETSAEPVHFCAEDS